MRRHRTAILRGVGGAVVVMLVLSVKVLAASRGELELGERAEAQHDSAVAITHYRRAARWYLPIQPFADDALDRLSAIGDDAERAGDVSLALASFRSVRAAIMSSRTLFLPDHERLDRADARIAALMARNDVPPIDAELAPAEREALYLDLLEQDRDPSAPWALLALLGLVMWVSAAYLLFTRALDEDDRFIDGPLRLWGGVLILGMGCFMLGLALS